MYRLQNAAVAVSAFGAFVASYLGLGSFLYWACVLALIFVAAVSSIGCQGSSLSVEREWTKALCQGDSASLAGLNAGGSSSEVCKMRQHHALRIHGGSHLCVLHLGAVTSPGGVNAIMLHSSIPDLCSSESLTFHLPCGYRQCRCASWVTRGPYEADCQLQVRATTVTCKSVHAGMRRIDLTCLIASPIMAGLLMTFGSIRLAIAGILMWNMLAWWPECRLLELAQQLLPVLR